MPKGKMTKPSKKQILEALNKLWLSIEVPSMDLDINDEVTRILKTYKMV